MRSGSERIRAQRGEQSARKPQDVPLQQDSPDRSQPLPISDGGGKPSTTNVSDLPLWATGETPVIADTDKQVLVVGDGIAGLTVSLLLSRAGYDLLRVAGTETSAASELTHLWGPASRLLEVIGLEPAVRNRSSRLESTVVRHPETSTEHRFMAATEPQPVVTRTDALLGWMRDELSCGVATDLQVRSSRCEKNAVEIEFNNGVREWFDLVITTGPGSPSMDARDGPATTTVTQCELCLDETLPNPREYWSTTAATQIQPLPAGGGSLLRQTAVRPSPDEEPTDEGWHASLSPEITDLISRSTNSAARRTLKTVSTVDIDVSESWWGSGTLLRCGPAALPLPPASGLRASLAIEDAWVLAEELLQGGQGTGVGSAFGRRRRDRIQALMELALARTDGRYPVSVGSPLRAVTALRELTLDRTQEHDPDTETDVFDAL